MPNADGLTDREAAIDAVIRFVCSLDSADASLLASSLTSNTTMDLSSFAKAGMTPRVVHGRDEIVDLLMSVVGRPLDTTHCATNIRCKVKGDEAELTCCVLAQHFRGGQGPSPEFQEYWFNGNQYRCEVVRGEEGDGLWRLKRVEIVPAWTLGNPEVMKG